MKRDMKLGLGILAIALGVGCSGGSEDEASRTPAPVDVEASTDFHDRVKITWGLPKGAKPSGFMVLRDDLPIAELPAGVREYEDTTAGPGRLEAPSLEAEGREDAVSLSWQEATAHPGATHDYRIFATYPGGASAASGVAAGGRSGPDIVGYLLRRDGEKLLELAATARDFLDLGAAPPVLEPPSDFSASTNRTNGIVLSWRPASHEPGKTHSYTIEAMTAGGPSEPSPAVSAHRIAPTVVFEYEVRRDGGPWVATSSDDSHQDLDAPVGKIEATVVTTPHPVLGYVELDLDEVVFSAPSASYQLRLVGFDDVAPLSATGRRGWREEDLSVQWQRAPAGTDPDFEDIPGATQLPYNDLDADGSDIAYRVTLQATGASGLSSTGEAAAILYKAVSARRNHACGIRAADGKVQCWGDNSDGQAPPEPTEEAFKAISTGDWHTCGIRESDGKVLCWGNNESRQAPRDPSEKAFTHIAAGGLHTCGILEDGKIQCWGRNVEGQAPRDPTEKAFTDVSAGYAHTCGIREEDGKVQCWGFNFYGQAPENPPGDVFSSVRAGTNHTCGILEIDGKVICWGENQFGQGATGPTDDAYVEITAGDNHNCGILEADGKVRCWGWDSHGQAPWNPTADAYTNIATGDQHTCGVRVADSKVACWGRNHLGQAPRLPAVP